MVSTHHTGASVQYIVYSRLFGYPPVSILLSCPTLDHMVVLHKKRFGEYCSFNSAARAGHQLGLLVIHTPFICLRLYMSI